MEKKKLMAVTHSGIFHADEVMASVILKELYNDVEIKRSRNPEDFELADIVFDVGGGEYDHHSDGKEFRENGVPYAACGLIWRAFGSQLISKIEPSLLDSQVEEIRESIDGKIIESIDATDNGHPIEKGDVHIPTLDQLVKSFNPTWNSDLDAMEQFDKAIDFCKPILLNALSASISSIEAEEMVKTSLDNREDDNILILDRFCPWRRHLDNHDEEGIVMYVIFKDLINGYRVQAVSEPDSRESKKPFPSEWAGKDAEEINRLIDIDDAIFVHPARFIAGAGSLDSVVKMAEIALED